MAAGKYNFTIEQGATFVKIIVVSADGNPLNLSDYSARLMARPSRGDGPAISLSTTAPTVEPITVRAKDQLVYGFAQVEVEAI